MSRFGGSLLGQLVWVTVLAAIGILILKYAAGRFPQVPGAKAIASL